MASKLLKVLSNIEEGRQACLQQIRKDNMEISDDASFFEIAPFINAGSAVRSLDAQSEVIPDWVRPAEWPDCHSLLYNAEEREDIVAGAIVLINGNNSSPSGTILLPRIGEATYGTCTGADAYLLSDGAWYNDTSAAITHTWDTTKDIIVTEGEYPGRYRWVMTYYTKNSNKNQFEVGAWNPTEILYIGPPNAGTAGDMTLVNSSQTLVNMEYLPECKSTAVRTTRTNQTTFYNMPELRHVDFGPVKGISCSSGSYNSPTYIGQNLPKLKKIDLSNLTSISCSSTWSLKGCINCTEFILSPNNTATTTIIMEGDYYYLTNIDAPNVHTLKADNTYYRPDLRMNTRVATDSLKWSTHYTGANISGGFVNNPILTHVTLTSISGTSFVGATSYYVASVPIMKYGCPNIKEIDWPKTVSMAIDVSNLKLSHSSILGLLESLYDFVENKASLGEAQPYIRISPSNRKMLSAEELAIATNKGWEVR